MKRGSGTFDVVTVYVVAILSMIAAFQVFDDDRIAGLVTAAFWIAASIAASLLRLEDLAEKKL